MLAIPALGRKLQRERERGDHEFKFCPGYLESCSLFWAYMVRPCHKAKQKKINIAQ